MKQYAEGGNILNILRANLQEANNAEDCYGHRHGGEDEPAQIG
jgi:hypothetical protein